MKKLILSNEFCTFSAGFLSINRGLAFNLDYYEGQVNLYNEPGYQIDFVVISANYFNILGSQSIYYTTLW